MFSVYNTAFDYFFKMSGNENILDMSNQIYDLCALSTFWDLNLFEKNSGTMHFGSWQLSYFLLCWKFWADFYWTKKASYFLNLFIALHRIFLKENHWQMTISEF